MEEILLKVLKKTIFKNNLLSISICWVTSVDDHRAESFSKWYNSMAPVLFIFESGLVLSFLIYGASVIYTQTLLALLMTLV